VIPRLSAFYLYRNRCPAGTFLIGVAGGGLYMRIPFLFLVAAAAVSGCATEAPEIPAGTLARDAVVNGFRVAVVDVCLASALKGAPVSELATETGPIVAATDTAALARSKPGETLWTSRHADSVLIKASQNECQVSANGAAVRAARDAVSEALSDPHGFAPETPEASDVRRYTKTVGGRTFRVTLAGPEGQTPGGTLVATVVSTPPA
jgi:hypothetical protein